MSNRIKNFLKNLTIEQLNEVRTISENLIYNYNDGFKYECHIRSYGRNWTQI
jgi:phenolic acid decarboxylase